MNLCKCAHKRKYDAAYHRFSLKRHVEAVAQSSLWTLRRSWLLRSPEIAFLALLPSCCEVWWVGAKLFTAPLFRLYSLQYRASTRHPLSFVGNYSLTFRPTGLRREMWRVQLHRDALPVELNVSTCREKAGGGEAEGSSRGRFLGAELK